MKLSRHKKAEAWDRRDELRKGRVAAEPLRTACPDAASVRVDLEFRYGTQAMHAAQSCALFPPAKAHFVYPCPYGDCSGLYDLQAVALGTLRGSEKDTKGMLECSGIRCRGGAARQPCELQMSYSITLEKSRVSAGKP
ncbi:MAG: hypothetical protein WDO68_16835 [Gammaproteobacteria bacterium]